MPKYKNIINCSKRTRNRRMLVKTAPVTSATTTVTLTQDVTTENESALESVESVASPASVEDAGGDTDDEEYLSQCSDDDDEIDKPKIGEFLRSWTQQYQIQKNALSKLLKGLIAFGHSDLPSDSRTLLQTPTQRSVVNVPPGQYCHIGLKKALNCYMELCTEEDINEVTLDFNIDGVPLSRSTKSCFWLILAKITGGDSIREIFVIGVYHGYNKPNDFAQFLDPFITEITELKRGGYNYNDHAVTLTIRCIICDAPARNSCLGNKSHIGFYGCGRCVQEGVCIKHRMTFPKINCSKRTNESFRSQDQAEHHNYNSPFLRLNIDIVRQFPLDYLHTLCLGVVKKMLHMWRCGDLPTRLQSFDVQQISDRLSAVAEQQPSEFQRPCRPLSELSNFKGTELRTLILYVLPVVTCGILPVEQYRHLLNLHVAVVILADPTLARTHADVAQKLLEHFVRSFSSIYGSHHVVYNVHSLVHIVDDVKLFGCLDNYSAFPFESHMSTLKRMLKNNKHPLAELSNRLEESYIVPIKIVRNIRGKFGFNKVVKVVENNVPTMVHHELVFDDFIVNRTLKNRWFSTDENDVFRFEYAKKDECTVFARKVISKSSFYDLPISSDKFGIFISNGILSEIMSIPTNRVQHKIFAMPFENNTVFVPLRHCSDNQNVNLMH